ncbi:MAG: DUF427 domain-containing protein [Pseudomonadota bacterium]
MRKSYSESSNSMVTLATDLVHNPTEHRHYMKIKPFSGTVKIWQADKLIVESNAALLVLEVGKGFYDPIFYVPPGDVLVGLYDVRGKTTHCPLKGDAHYFAISGLEIGDNQYFAWSYEHPFEFASELSGYFAFNPEFVRIETKGTRA